MSPSASGAGRDRPTSSRLRMPTMTPAEDAQDAVEPRLLLEPAAFDELMSDLDAPPRTSRLRPDQQHSEHADLELVVSLLKRCGEPMILDGYDDGWCSVVLGCAHDTPPEEVAALLRVLQ